MKKTALYRLFSGIIFFTFLFNSSFAQGMPMNEIDRAMKEGDAGMLVQYFGSSVDIMINNAQSTYSPAQAEMVLRKFFTKNSVRNFELENSGKVNSSNGVFWVGTLLTVKGSFKVFFYLKPKDNKLILQRISLSEAQKQ